MKIFLPCDFGEYAITQKGIKALTGVTWFKWQDGLEFTYFYESAGKWQNSYFENEKNSKYELYYEIDDGLLCDGFLKEKGFPIKGRGYVTGLSLIDDRLFAEIILTDKYLAHIYVECNKNGRYEEGGSVVVPPSWDTIEKQYSIIFKEHRNIKISPSKFRV